MGGFKCSYIIKGGSDIGKVWEPLALMKLVWKLSEVLAPVVPHNYITEVRQVEAATGKADAAGEEVSGVEPAATVGVMEPSPKILCLISAVSYNQTKSDSTFPHYGSTLSQK